MFPMRFHIRIPYFVVVAGIILIVGIATAALIDMTLEDFHLSGTQVGDVSTSAIWTSDNCLLCHGPYDEANDPMSTWSGSLMANAGRDPLFFAQMATANQDVANAGYFCMRCHVPMSFVTGHALDADGSTLDATDMDGINCHFCHSMVDPVYKPGVSPPEDVDVLAGLDDVPEFYGNAMFVLDPLGRRRGPRADAQPMHEFIESPFHRSGDFCGTCHDVGNVAVSLQKDGTYAYNAIDQPTPSEDLWHQFPLERTYTEWKLSDFANGGVDMGGRFGGHDVTVVESCQDCHMPRAVAQACQFAPEHDDMARHDFAGGAAPVLDLIAELHKDDPAVDQDAIAAARAKSVSMLERAADIELEQQNGSLRVRVVNQTGHKLPTGHIEGRRVWVNVQFHAEDGSLVREHGHYDDEEAMLDEDSTEVYEMLVGLSEAASKLTGYPAGVTTHMALADTIVKDNRIPPRGYDIEAFIEGGAPAVQADYADGQYWDDSYFSIPVDAATATVAIYYQNLPRHYVEHLRDANVTNHWGDTLYDLWVTTGKGAPIEMDLQQMPFDPFLPGDLNGNGVIDFTDLMMLFAAWGQDDVPEDLNGDRHVDVQDLLTLLNYWAEI